MTPDTTFDRLYRDVPEEQRDALRRFRASHPLKLVTLGKTTWEYIVSGQGSHSLLVLGGGFSLADTMFQMIARLEGRYRVLSPSYPPLATAGPVLDGLTALLAAEGIERAHVYGHSLGAALAHAFVRRAPDRVDKLVLSNFGLYTPGRARLARLFARLLAALPYGATRAYYQRAITRLLARADPAERALMRAYMTEVFTQRLTKPMAMAQLSLLVDLADHPDVYRLYTPVERPSRVLLIQAKDDSGFTDTELAALAATYPGAREHTFASGGHLVAFARPEEYEALLDGFLDRG